MIHETVVVGGYASAIEQYRQIAAQLESHYGAPFRGVNFSTAMGDLNRLGEVIESQPVITHSAGALAVNMAMQRGAKPESLTMIAPPIPERVRSLVVRGILIGFNDPSTIEDVEEKIANHSSIREVRQHPLRHAEALARLGHFHSFDFAREAQQEGVATQIGFMQKDGLFNLSTVHEDTLSMLQASDVPIKEIQGSHTRFTINPVGTMRELASASSYASELPATVDTLSVHIRESVLPRLGQVASRLRTA